MRDAGVELRSPFPAEDVPRIWTWMEPFRWRVSDDFSPKTLAEFIPYFRALEERGRTWAVYRAAELGGVISFEKVSPAIGTAHCAFKKSFWGQRTSVPALQEATRQMLADVPKLSLPVFQGNQAMIAMLKKAGAVHEGVLKRHSQRGGKPIDVLMLAMFRN